MAIITVEVVEEVSKKILFVFFLNVIEAKILQSALLV